MLAGCVTLGALPPASAQGGWFEQAKRILQGFGGDGAAQSLSASEKTAGLKEALRVGTDRVVLRLGAVDGFNGDPRVHVPLPDTLVKVRAAPGRLELSAKMDDLALRLNRAAETATPKVDALFLESIRAMTLEDARAVDAGPDDAATRTFEARMSAPLAREIRPMLEQSRSRVGAVQAYEAALGRYRDIPFVPDVKADLTGYVVDKRLQGIFFYLAREEAAIRGDRTARSTEPLKKVFGARAAGE